MLLLSTKAMVCLSKSYTLVVLFIQCKNGRLLQMLLQPIFMMAGLQDMQGTLKIRTIPTLQKILGGYNLTRSDCLSCSPCLDPPPAHLEG